MQNGIRKLIHSTVSISVDILRVSLHVRLNKHQLLIADIYHHKKKNSSRIYHFAPFLDCYSNCHNTHKLCTILFRKLRYLNNLSLSHVNSQKIIRVIRKITENVGNFVDVIIFPHLNGVSNWIEVIKLDNYFYYLKPLSFYSCRFNLINSCFIFFSFIPMTSIVCNCY